LQPLFSACISQYYARCNTIATGCSYIAGKFEKLSEDDFKEIDYLAGLMVNPDSNFDILHEIWNAKKIPYFEFAPGWGLG
jgi:hypothetical protein